MTDPLDALVLDLLRWLAARPRTYDETMAAWRTSCPRLPVWEDAVDRGFVARGTNQNVALSERGRAFIEQHGSAATGHAAAH